MTLRTLSSVPNPALHPNDENQTVKPAMAWNALIFFSSMLPEQLRHGQDREHWNLDRVKRVHYDGIWRWSVYFHYEYLRGSRIIQSPLEWSKLFCAIEYIFSNGEEISHDWNKWIIQTPALLRLLTDLWESQVSRLNRIQLAEVYEKYDTHYKSAVATLFRSAVATQNLSEHWCALAGGVDRVVGILISRFVHLHISEEPHFMRSDRAGYGVLVDAEEETYTLWIIVALVTHLEAFRTAFIRRNGLATMVKCYSMSPKLAKRATHLQARPLVQQVFRCVTILAAHSLPGLKQSLCADMVSTVRITLQADETPHQSLHEDLFFFLHLIGSNTIHFSVIYNLIKDAEFVVAASHFSGNSSPRIPRVMEAWKYYNALLEYRIQASFRGEPRLLHTARKQICGYPRCDVCFQTLSRSKSELTRPWYPAVSTSDSEQSISGSLSCIISIQFTPIGLSRP